jgi:UDP-N-acetylglucosamine 3-dehydrogenase
MKTLRWAIVGLGRFGAIHASTIRSLAGAELAVICNHNSQTLEQAAVEFPEARAICDPSDVFARSDVDIVNITTHWQQHFELAKAALLSGKHVFLEKPMAATSAECRELVALAKQSPGYLMVGHVCRFDPRVSQAQQIIADGRLGHIVSMHAKRNLPKAPGNIRLDKISPLLGDGIHDADLMMWFMQKMPTRVYARNIRTGGFQYPDLGWAMLEFMDQAVGVIETVWCLPENVPTVIDARLEVIGTDGMLTIDCSQTGLQLVTTEGVRIKDTVYWPEQYGHRVGALPQQLAYFADCVRQQRPPDVITPREAAQAVIVMESAERSAVLGQPVEVDCDLGG